MAHLTALITTARFPNVNVQVEVFGTGAFSQVQKRVWDLFEKPQSSIAAKVIAVISVIFIVISMISMTLSTLPALQVRRNVSLSTRNGTEESDRQHHLLSIRNSRGELTGYEEVAENPVLAVVEGVCVGWFTIEFAARFFACPNKFVFVKTFLNVVDVVAILPYYVSLLLETQQLAAAERFSTLQRIVQVFRILRILRILKVSDWLPA